MERYAVLIDLSSQRLGANMFRKLMSDLEEKGTVDYIKFYNYSTKRHREFRTIVKEYGIEVDLPEQGKKRVRMDVRQIIDGIRIASTCPSITTFFIIGGEIDGMHFFNSLKKLGKEIVMGVTSRTPLSDKAHRVYMLDRNVEVDEVAIASLESKVKGDKDSIFPYSDIKEDNEKMREIDRRILEMISSKRNIDNVFLDK